MNRGVGDCWVLKLDNSGNIIWQKSFGGSDEDAATAIFPMSTGGYIVTGWTYSHDYDFKNKGQHGEGDIFIATISSDNSSNTQYLIQGKPVFTKQESQGRVNYELRNFPNPASNFTTITYSIPQPGKVCLKIINEMGRPIKTLVSGQQVKGIHALRWNMSDEEGNKVPTGIYFLRMEVNNYSEVKELLILR